MGRALAELEQRVPFGDKQPLQPVWINNRGRHPVNEILTRCHVFTHLHDITDRCRTADTNSPGWEQSTSRIRQPKSISFLFGILNCFTVIFISVPDTYPANIPVPVFRFISTRGMARLHSSYFNQGDPFPLWDRVRFRFTNCCSVIPLNKCIGSRLPTCRFRKWIMLFK